MEFDEWFESEADCEDFLRRLRWPKGFYCPGCGAAGGWETSRGLFRCSSCARQTSVTAGTLFEGTRKPLRLWFQAMWYFTNQKHGVSALGLQRILGLGSYQTGLGMAPQVSSGNGAAKPGSLEWRGRSR